MALNVTINIPLNEVVKLFKDLLARQKKEKITFARLLMQSVKIPTIGITNSIVSFINWQISKKETEKLHKH